MPCHLSKREFERLVEEAIAELPQQFRDFLEEVTIEIQTRPTRKMLRDVGLEDDELLFGLYQGVNLVERSVMDHGRLPDRILIFQEDHELVCESRKQLIEEVRKTVLHEIGHHFGMSEDDLDQLGYG